MMISLKWMLLSLRGIGNQKKAIPGYNWYMLCRIERSRIKMSTRRGNETLDTYLLKVFCILMAERSVSRTALKLNQSQPAISVALKNLRQIFQDPLLVREKGGMVPTGRAQDILEHAKSALSAIDAMLVADEAFVPEHTRQVFRIGSPDYLAPAFAASVVARLRREAPHARLVLHSLGPDFDFERSLAEGELDVVIGNWPEPPDRMHLSMLLEDKIVCLVDADHPLARRGMTLDDFRRVQHVVPTPYSISQRGTIDTVLTSLRIQREECIEVQSFMLAPYLLPGTDLVFTTARHFARYYAGLLPLAIVEAPIEFPPMRFYQLWHARNQHDESHQWLRHLLGDCGRRMLTQDWVRQRAGGSAARRTRGGHQIAQPPR
jgi:DNA-binding transcriptional LysR family regulator